VTNKNSPLILNKTWITLSEVKEIMNMKKLNVTLAILVAAVMAGNAQTVTSGVVGYSRVDVPKGTRAVVPGFVKSEVFTGVGSVTSQTLSASGLSANALSPTSFTGKPNYPTHYIEIISGAYEGYSFDVSSNTASSVTVSGLPSALNGTQVNYVIRPHLTLGDIDSSNIPDGALVLNIFNNPDAPAVTYLYDSAGSWYDGSGSFLMNHVVIYPGVGVSLNSNANSSFSITFTGNVKSTKTAVPLYRRAAVNLVGPMNPSTTSTLTEWAAALPNGTVANILSSTGNNGVSLTLITDDGSTILYDGAGNTLSSTSIAGQNAFAMSAMSQDGFAIFKSPLQP
jgi:hypothetical protein